MFVVTVARYVEQSAIHGQESGSCVLCAKALGYWDFLISALQAAMIAAVE
jgi:hypothetical protein